LEFFTPSIILLLASHQKKSFFRLAIFLYGLGDKESCLQRRPLEIKVIKLRVEKVTGRRPPIFKLLNEWKRHEDIQFVVNHTPRK
jgi:hypothetical protein